MVEFQKYWGADKLSSVCPDQCGLVLKMKFNLAVSTGAT